MEDERSLVSYHIGEYGGIRIKLAEVLDSRGITRNRLGTLTGIKYGVIDRYYRAESVERVDLDIFARICYVLNCKIEDLLEYEEPT